MWIVGVIIYLSIGFLFYSYHEYVYSNLIDREDLGQFERKTFESEHSPSLIKSLAFWPLETVSWAILWMAYTSR